MTVMSLLLSSKHTASYKTTERFHKIPITDPDGHMRPHMSLRAARHTATPHPGALLIAVCKSASASRSVSVFTHADHPTRYTHHMGIHPGQPLEGLTPRLQATRLEIQYFLI